MMICFDVQTENLVEGTEGKVQNNLRYYCQSQDQDFSEVARILIN